MQGRGYLVTYSKGLKDAERLVEKVLQSLPGEVIDKHSVRLLIKNEIKNVLREMQGHPKKEIKVKGQRK